MKRHKEISHLRRGWQREKIWKSVGERGRGITEEMEERQLSAASEKLPLPCPSTKKHLRMEISFPLTKFQGYAKGKVFGKSLREISLTSFLQAIFRG